MTTTLHHSTRSPDQSPVRRLIIDQCVDAADHSSGTECLPVHVCLSVRSFIGARQPRTDQCRPVQRRVLVVAVMVWCRAHVVRLVSIPGTVQSTTVHSIEHHLSVHMHSARLHSTTGTERAAVATVNGNSSSVACESVHQ